MYKRAGVGLLMSLLAISYANAQQKVEDPYEIDNFAVYVDAYVEVTDNRDSTAEGVNNTDWFIRPKIEGKYAIGGNKKRILDFYYAPYYRYREDPSPTQNDTELYHELYARYDSSISPRSDFRVFNLFTYTDDPAINKDGSQLRRDSSYYFDKVEMGVNYAFSRESYVDIYGNYRFKRYDDSVASDESDEDIGVAHISYLTKLYKYTSLVLDGLVSDVQYAKTTIDRGFTTFAGGVGLETVWTKDARLSFRAGVQGTTYQDSSVDDEVNPYVVLSGTYSTRPDFKITGSVSYKTRESDVYPYSSQETVDFDLNLVYDFNKYFSFVGDGMYVDGTYKYDNVADGLKDSVKTGDQSQDTKVLQGQIVYHLNDNTSFRLVQRYEDVESDVKDSYTRNSTTLMVSQKF